MTAVFSTRTIRTDRGDDRKRLDVTLVRHLADRPDISRSQIQSWIEGGLVRVNGTPAAKPSSRLMLWDEIEVVLPPPPPPRPAPAAEEMPLSILFEDEHLVAIDKPPGLVVHPSPGHRQGTMINALFWRARDWGEDRRPSLVNRLDQGTSGVLMVAKTPAVHTALARNLRSRDTVKEYLALVYRANGALPKGRIDLKILRDPVDLKRRMASKTEGRDSVTLYERLAGDGGLALLRCRLLTGRTHQIRVHLKSQGWPIVGDALYGEPRWKGFGDPALAAACRDFPRQALHAWRLAFVHPATGAAMEIVAPVAEDMAGLLAAARLQAP
jgi:23S rRNA pseudouridine1911/1915/1917 synthase